MHAAFDGKQRVTLFIQDVDRTEVPTVLRENTTMAFACLTRALVENIGLDNRALRYGALELLDPFARQNVRSARFARVKFQSDTACDVLIDQLVQTQQSVAREFRRPVDDRLFGRGGA